ncbi:MAG: alanine:cation symporter family protein, partial [Candidatus Zixiibacteriota bacterium]
GYNFGSKYVYVYIVSLFFGAIWSQDIVLNMLDTMFATMAIPTLIGSLLLSPAVVRETKDYFRRMRE